MFRPILQRFTPVVDEARPHVKDSQAGETSLTEGKKREFGLAFGSREECREMTGCAGSLDRKSFQFKENYLRSGEERVKIPREH